MGFITKGSKDIEHGYIKFKGNTYAFDLEEIKRFCLISSDQNGKETEVTEAYDTNNEDGTLAMTSKIFREVKSTGNPQNDMIIYDVVKLFIIRLLENASTEAEFDIDFSTALAINTMLKWKMLIEVK